MKHSISFHLIQLVSPTSVHINLHSLLYGEIKGKNDLVIKVQDIWVQCTALPQTPPVILGKSLNFSVTKFPLWKYVGPWLPSFLPDQDPTLPSLVPPSRSFPKYSPYYFQAPWKRNLRTPKVCLFRCLRHEQTVGTRQGASLSDISHSSQLQSQLHIAGIAHTHELRLERDSLLGHERKEADCRASASSNRKSCSSSVAL